MSATQTHVTIIQEDQEENGTEELLARVSLPEKKEPHSKPILGAMIGELTGIGPSGEPLVNYPGNPVGPLPAIASAPFGVQDVGCSVTLLFEGGNPAKPILMGLVRKTASQSQPVTMELDGQRMVFTAKQEIVLRCGKASITLTKAGKVLIRGAYLLNRSSGVNRIKGGSVQIN